MTAPAITPAIIDRDMPIEAIRIAGRHRTDLGDIAALARSIADVGLLNPITLTHDCRLVAGQRRLEAFRSLGWDTIPVRFVDSLDDAARLLRAERDENTERKEMLPSEKASLGEALYEIEAGEAKERQGTRTDLGKQLPGLETGKLVARGDTRDLVGEVLGMDGRTYSDLRFVYTLAHDVDAPEDEQTLATEALKAMDSGHGIQATARKVRGTVRAKRDALADPEPQTDGDPRDHPDWVPSPTDRSARGSERRRELIREMAARGCTSHQISDRIGTDAITIRRIAREEGITIHADETLGARTRKTIDSNRVVRETVTGVQGFLAGLKLVRFDELDPAEVKDWTVSLTESIRVLNRLNKKLKERVQ